MSAVIIDGKAVAEGIHERVTIQAHGIGIGDEAPTLAVVLCGDNPGSAIYVRNKGRVAERVGIRFQLHTPPASSTTAQLEALVRRLSSDERVDAILVQLPLPDHVDADPVIDAVDPAKDADGFHPLNFGRLAEGRQVAAPPCTPAGCLELLRHYRVPIAGRRAVVVGRSTIVGRPVSVLLTNADATVTLCHSKTADLPDVCSAADILVAATGRPGMIDSRYVKRGAAVVDVGITSTAEGISGDVDRASVEPVAGWLTPVPGGVGPMTIAMLMQNTVTLAGARRRVAAA